MRIQLSTVAITAIPFAVVLAIFMIAGIVVGKPARSPAKEPEAKKAIPDLAGESNWGFVSQAGTSIQINGHSSWYAIGLIRPDGKVQITWTLTDGSRSGIGVYTVEGCDLIGRWGWCEVVEVDKAGDLQGETSPDITRKIKPPEPDFK